MAESSDHASKNGRAAWVGMRTLRQRPHLVGRTKAGEPVFEVRSVRLVLKKDANHFNRLLECTKCSADIAGQPVLRIGDLDGPSYAGLCESCSRVAATPARRHQAPGRHQAPAKEVVAPPRQMSAVPEHPAEPPDAAPEVADDGRLAAAEARIDVVTARCDQLAGSLEAEHAKRRQIEEAPAPGLSPLQLVAGIADLRAEVASSSDAHAAKLAALEEFVGHSITGIVQLHHGQERELAATSAALAEARAEIARLAESNAELGRLQVEADRRGVAMAAKIADLPPVGEVAEAIRSGLEEVRTHVELSLAGQRAELDAVVTAGLSGPLLEIASLKQRLDENVANLTQLVEDKQSDLGASVEGLRPELATLTEAVQELTGFRDRLEERLDDLVPRIAHHEVQMGELSASSDAIVSRLQVLERRIDEAVRQLTQRAEDHEATSSTLVAAELHAALDAGLSSTRSEIASLKQQLDDNVVALTEMVQGTRSAGDKSLRDRVGRELAPLAEAVQQLMGFRTEVVERLDGLDHRALEDQKLLGSWSSSLDAREMRLQGLEGRIEESVHRLTGLIESEVDGSPPTNGGRPSSLLAGLERQLQEADRRLTCHTLDPGDH